MARHHRLGPSSSDRWSTCTKSVEMTLEHNLQGISSSYAEEGSYLHDVTYRQLTNQWTEEQETALLPGYATAIRNALQMFYSNMFFSPDDYLLKYEVFLNMHINKTMITGTADIIGLSKNRILVVDWKYGQGYKVHIGNSLYLYALGAYQSLLSDKEQKDIELFDLAIIQPRYKTGPHFDVDILTKQQLTKKLLPMHQALTRIRNKQFEFVPSYGNCIFCPAKHMCHYQYVGGYNKAETDDIFKEANK